MKEKNLALFIYEVLFLLYGDNFFIDEDLLSYINSFIYQYCRDYKGEFSLLFSNKLLEQLIEGKKYEVLPIEVVYYLLEKYMGDEKYAELVDDVGRESGDKINNLATAFILYLQILQQFNNKKTDGPYRILQ